MPNADGSLQPAIDELEQELANLERQGNAILISLNILRAKAGLPPRPGGWSNTPSEPLAETGRGPLSIQSDTFLGKRMGSAAREYLEMRKRAGGDAPATVREIFDDLTKGGFDFRSKDERNAMIVLGAMLRKNTTTFHRVQKGKYGLRSWYPHLKAPKATDAEDEGGDEQETKPQEKTAANKAASAA